MSSNIFNLECQIEVIYERGKIKKPFSMLWNLNVYIQVTLNIQVDI